MHSKNNTLCTLLSSVCEKHIIPHKSCS